MGYAYSKHPAQLTLAGKITPNLNLLTAAADQELDASDYFTLQFRLLRGYTVVDAYLDLIIRELEDTSGLTNYLSGNQSLQVRSAAAGGAWDVSTYLPSACLAVQGSERVAGMRVYGQRDIKTETQKAIDADSYLRVQWAASKANQNALIVVDLQPLVRVNLI